MREVDTSVLQDVARSLGIGNPATARAPVVFDDGNLQQMWDATKYGRLPIVRGTFEIQGGPAVAVTTTRFAFSTDDLLNPGVSGDYADRLVSKGLQLGNTDIYLLGFVVAGEVANIANVAEAAIGVRQLPSSLGPPHILFRGTNSKMVANTMEAGSLFTELKPFWTGIDSLRGALPFLLNNNDDPAGDILFFQGSSGGGGGVDFVWSCRLAFVPKGLPVWYAL
mgnify:CR=1 FL=1